MKVNPRTITYVRAVAEERSFSKAAEKLYITQPSLSQHILNAEKEYGVQFFNRRSVPITLTFAGERFLSIADEMELLDKQLNREMEDINGNITGRITVGVSPTRGAWFIPQLFAQFKNRYPGVELILMEDSNIKQLEAVRSGKVDFAFTGYREDDLESLLIAERNILLAVRKDTIHAKYAARDEIGLREFAQTPFILLKKGRGIRRIVDGLFAQEGIQPIIAYETSSYNMAVGMARQGLGCTFVIDHEIQVPEGMAVYRITGMEEAYRLYLVYRKDSYISQSFQYFIDLAAKVDTRAENE